MKNWFSPILSGIASAAATWLLSIGATKMPAIASDFLRTFWPLLVGGVVGLIVWNVQFFRHYKHEKDAELRSWVIQQEKNWEKNFSALADKRKSEWETAHAAIEGSHAIFERRLSRVEDTMKQTEDGQQS